MVRGHINQSQKANDVIKIYRERRAPFNPATVKRLIQKDGVKVIVQPSNRRAYPMQVKINSFVL